MPVPRRLVVTTLWGDELDMDDGSFGYACSKRIRFGMYLSNRVCSCIHVGLSYRKSVRASGRMVLFRLLCSVV